MHGAANDRNPQVLFLFFITPKYARSGQLGHDTCYGNGAPDCNVVVWWRDACGALALSDNGVYGSAWSDTIDAAHRAAISYCVFEGGEACYLEASNC